MFRIAFILVFAHLVYGYHLPCHDGKIVGGQPTDIESYPYQLSFEYRKRHRCGASLIRPNVALTAAHCTEDVGGLENYLTVRAGSSLVQKGGQEAKVLSICDHPKFNMDALDYDVSVLLLSQSFILGASVQTISLQPVNVEVPTGTMASVTGWGRLSDQGPLPEKLQTVQVPKIEQPKCVEIYSKDAAVTDRMICFGYIQGGKDTCQGDSGGPLVANGKLVGIISWGFGCAAPNRPGVYAKISNPEISSHINTCLAKFGKL